MGDEIAELLEVDAPSAIARRDAALTAKGLGAAELADAKTALVAVAVGTPEAAKAPAALRDRVLASMKRTGRFGMFADRLARLFDVSVSDAEALCAKLETGAEWHPFLVPGVEMIPVAAGPKHAGTVATLVRIQPGASFPEHEHRGEETMFVLDGGFRETAEGGAEVWRGDELHREDGTGHAFVALPGTPCIAAAVVSGYADFK